MLRQTSVRRIIFLILLIIFLPVTRSPRAALAESQTPSDDEVNRIASQLYCPICDNVSLDVCPFEACQTWRDLIRQQLVEGWTDREIKDYFVAQYGDRVLGAPPPRGLNWMLYLAPPIVILLGFAMLLSKLRRVPKQEPSSKKKTYEDPFLAQVERDLRNLEES